MSKVENSVVLDEKGKRWAKVANTIETGTKKRKNLTIVIASLTAVAVVVACSFV